MKRTDEEKELLKVLELWQAYWNTTGKAFRKPGTQLEKELVERMEALGLEIN